ncbi:hypothetical protein GmHk_16G046527 [Glycine max]|nr:hypothetical protein GmHk_16G046527 [Glycine max]
MPFRVNFCFRCAFEDGEGENTVFIVGQCHLMIFSEPIELFEFCSSSKYSRAHQILVICDRVYVVTRV